MADEKELNKPAEGPEDWIAEADARLEQSAELYSNDYMKRWGKLDSRGRWKNTAKQYLTQLENARKMLSSSGEGLVLAIQDADEQRKAKDGAYYERNKLVLLLASIYPSGIKRTSIPGWSEDWHGCVYIDFPWGQASWHYHDSHAHLFEHLPQYADEWDGHTTDSKYAAICAAAQKHIGDSSDAGHIYTLENQIERQAARIRWYDEWAKRLLGSVWKASEEEPYFLLTPEVQKILDEFDPDSE